MAPAELKMRSFETDEIEFYKSQRNGRSRCGPSHDGDNGGAKIQESEPAPEAFEEHTVQEWPEWHHRPQGAYASSSPCAQKRARSMSKKTP